MEGVFGTSFAGVRTHTGPEGARLAQSENTAAFASASTSCSAGQHKPGTLEGDVLLAHELAHVAQQRDAEPVLQAMSLSDGPTSALEQDANRSALAAVSGYGAGRGRTRCPRSSRAFGRRSPASVAAVGQKWSGNAGNTEADAITSTSASRRGTLFSRDSPNFEVTAASAASTAASRSCTGSRATSVTRPTPCRGCHLAGPDRQRPVQDGDAVHRLHDAGVGPHDHDQGGRRDALQHRVLDRRGGLSAGLDRWVVPTVRVGGRVLPAHGSLGCSGSRPGWRCSRC